MRYVKLPKRNFNEFINGLSFWGEVHGPQKRGSSYVFAPLNDANQIALDYVRTILPPKKYFIKPKDPMMVFEGSNVRDLSDSKAIVLFGVHSCDIHALRILDRVFLSDPPDPFYLKRRKNTKIIGISCMPDEYCFCKSVGTHYAMSGFDLFLHELPDGFLIRVGTVTGHEMIWRLQNLFEEVTQDDLENLKKFEEERERSFKRNLNLSALPDILDLAYDSEVWKKYEERCLGCGNCTLVCPTCRCYDVCDRWIDAYSSVRERRYDSCFMESHALVAGGHNFRPSRLDRFRHRYYCKNYFDPEIGLNCVGCGRCDEFCPAEIRHIEVLEEVRRSLL